MFLIIVCVIQSSPILHSNCLLKAVVQNLSNTRRLCHRVMVAQDQTYAHIMPIHHGILQVEALVAVVLQRSKLRTDTSKQPIAPSLVDTSAVEYTEGGSGQLDAASQSDIGALTARMKILEAEYAQRIEAIERENARMKEAMETKEAGYEDEIAGIREKVGRQSFL